MNLAIHIAGAFGRLLLRQVASHLSKKRKAQAEQVERDRLDDEAFRLRSEAERRAMAEARREAEAARWTAEIEAQARAEVAGSIVSIGAPADLAVATAIDLSNPESWMRDAPKVDPHRRELAAAIREQIDARGDEVILGPTDGEIAARALEGY